MQNSPYNQDFYSTQSHGSYRSAQKIVPMITHLFPQITQVVDIGCGVGTWLKAWKDINPHMHILGIDGNNMEEDAFFISKQYYQQLNLTDDYQKNLKIISQKIINGGGGQHSFNRLKSQNI